MIATRPDKGACPIQGRTFIGRRRVFGRLIPTGALDLRSHVHILGEILS
jgi:hypothetical protein